MKPATLTRLKRFAQDIEKGSGLLKRVAEGVANGAEHAGELIDHYNKFAPWLALPVIPVNPFKSDK